MKRRNKPKKKIIKYREEELPPGFKKGVKKEAKKKLRAETKNLTREY